MRVFVVNHYDGERDIALGMFADPREALKCADRESMGFDAVGVEVLHVGELSDMSDWPPKRRRSGVINCASDWYSVDEFRSLLNK